MSENTKPAACTADEFHAARAAGLFVITTADEEAIHKFAGAMRAELLEALQELLDAEGAPFPPFEAGKDVQDAWTQRRATVRTVARSIIAKATGAA